MKSKGSRAGFSRIELLTVMAMSLLAVGWLVWGGQAWQAAHKESRRAACVAQMKELGQSFLMCAQAEERLPRSAGKSRMATNDWIYWQTNRNLAESVIARYHLEFTPQALRCPQDASAPNRSYAFSYTMNEHLSQRRLFREGPRGIVLLAEEEAANDGSWAPGNPADSLTARHDGLANIVLGDGHVEKTIPRPPLGPGGMPPRP